MKALIMMLINRKTNTYHPIFYMEHPFIADEANETIIRYRSKGHHTTGFATRQKALDSIEEQLRIPLREQGYVILEELEEKDLLEWDGENIPADNQLRLKSITNEKKT